MCGFAGGEAVRAGAASGFAEGDAPGAVGSVGSASDVEVFAGAADGIAGDVGRLAVSLGFAAVVRGPGITASCPGDAEDGGASGVVTTAPGGALAGAVVERGGGRWLGVGDADGWSGTVAAGEAGDGGAIGEVDAGSALGGLGTECEIGAVAADGGGVFNPPSGRAPGGGAAVLPRPVEAITPTTMPPVRTPIAATIGQRRPLRRGIVRAPTEPEMVEGNARWAGAGSITAPACFTPMVPRVRCTEIAAWVSDPAYFASARASSATLGNRFAGSFSKQRYMIWSRSPGNRTVSLGSGSFTTFRTIAENSPSPNGLVPCSISYSTMPSDQMSLRWSTSRDDLICSGDMYAGVPITVWAAVSWPPTVGAFEIPKSRTLSSGALLAS